MFASIFDSFLPAYGVVAVALAVLLSAVVVVASRVLTKREVQCPATSESAEIIVGTQKRWPWTQARSTEVAQCSLMPAGVTCAQGCLNCGAKGPG